MALVLDGVLLGLGSVVRVETDAVSGLFVVLARGAFRPDPESDRVVGRYLVGPHPYGEAPDHETFPILASEVVDVVFEGYTDDADEAFLSDLLDQMEHGRRATVRAEQFKDALTVIPDRAPDPEDSAVDGGVSPGADPFGVVRRLLGDMDRKDEQ